MHSFVNSTINIFYPLIEYWVFFLLFYWNWNEIFIEIEDSCYYSDKSIFLAKSSLYFELKCKCRYNNHILKYYKSIIMKQSITIIPRYRRVHTPRYLEYRVICDRFIPLLMLIKFQCLNYPKNTILKIKRKIHLF